jgi:hypothetical protein
MKVDQVSPEPKTISHELRQFRELSSRNWRTSRLIIFLLLCLVAPAIDSSAQTLAEAARMERERQSKAQGKAVYTNAGVLPPSPVTPNPVTLPPGPSTTPGAAATPGASAAPSVKLPAGPTDRQGRDEKYWRSLFEKARADLTRAEQKAALAQLRINQLNTALMQNAAMYNRENRIGAEMTVAKSDLAAVNAEVEAAKQKIADLEEELRRAGGLPGWAR